MKTRIFTTAMIFILSVAMLYGKTSVKEKELKLSVYLENAVDPMIKIENWMINNLAWNRNAAFYLESENDEMLTIEPWMTNSSMWEKLETATDEKLEIERWMFDHNFWVKGCLDPATEKDRELKIEPWMINETNWK